VLQKICTQHGQFVTLQIPIQILPKMLITKLSLWTLKLEENLERVSEKCFYFRLLLYTRYFVCVQFNNPISIWSPSNHWNFCYFPHISMAINTPNKSPLKLIMKMDLIALWWHSVSNLMCCFSCFIFYASFFWGGTDGAMWCYCFTKQRFTIWHWWFRRRLELFIKWWFLFWHSR